MRISVVIPTRNHSDRIERFLRPLFSQTLPPSDYEVIVVDNASTDETPKILSYLAAKEANLKWVVEPSVGRSYARNRGIIEAQGDLLLFLDDDIEVGPNHLERHRDIHLQSTCPLAVLGNVRDVSPVRPAWLGDYLVARQRMVARQPPVDMPAVVRGLHFVTMNVSLLRSTLELVRHDAYGQPIYFDPSFLYREDGELGCRLAAAGVRLVFADEIQCCHYHPRTWKDIWARTYQVGYEAFLLCERYPELHAVMKYTTSSALANTALLVACTILFPLAYVIYPLWPEGLRKVVGGLLLYRSNQGFQAARRDRTKNRVAFEGTRDDSL